MSDAPAAGRDASAPASDASRRQDPRTRAILNGAPLPVMVRLATPSVMAFVVQAGVNMTEVWYVGQLGTQALAAMGFVFPGLMLMQMLAGGAMGGSVASAIARAMGSGDSERAQRLLWHALFIAACAAVLFFVLFVAFGRDLLLLLGARGAVLEMAMDYASIVFAGSISIWLTQILSGTFRGIGNMRFPAMLALCGGLSQVLLSGTLVLGWFGIPSMGIVGAAISIIAVATGSALVALAKLTVGKTHVPLRLEFAQLRAPLFVDIFRVGALAAISPFLSISSIMVVNGIISRFGDAMVAGYGIGSRLEFLLVPMVIGFGTAMNTMVGMNVGAGQLQRALRIAFIGGSLAAAITGSIGITLALFPQAWLGIFTEDPATIAAGSTYLRYSGWAFAFQGMGLSLYFASQGAGRVAWPVAANFFRFIIGAGGAALLVGVLGWSVEWVFICLAFGIATYGIVTAGSIWLGAWGRPAHD